MPADGQAQKNQGTAQQQPRKRKQPGGNAGSRAANAGSSASSARVSAEAGQPRKRDGQGRPAGARGKKAGSQQQVSSTETPICSWPTTTTGCPICQGEYHPSGSDAALARTEGLWDVTATPNGATGMSTATVPLRLQGPGRGPVRAKARGVGAMQRADSAGLRRKAAAGVMRPAQSRAAGGAAAAQQLSRKDLKSVTSLLSMVRENAGVKNG